ncbi:MAG: GH32 C-terminal domain-containing protein [Candidatus Poribacteria bacterium]|nr:GH32 C-terminal domain-containing protein [Candidatus Poribacteria bacterium]
MVSESERVESPRCFRPTYHFTPSSGRVGDPNGLCWHDGLYHLFYLHFPEWRQDSGRSSWGHLVSRDMICWREAPTAFFPGEKYDSQGCWSGCLRIIEGIPTIFYSGVGQDGVSACMATSEDMYQWSKSDENPLMTPERLRSNWDHCVWREGDAYLMLTGGKRGAELFESKDLRSWTYLHPLLAEDPARGLTKWDCPHLFRLGAEHVLIAYAHPMRQNIYFVGRYEGRRFHVENRGNLDIGVNTGGAFSAAHPSYRDQGGRTVVVGMMQECGQDAEAEREREWSGAISLSRVLTLGDDNRLRFDPIAEVESLRGRHWRFTDIGLAPGQTHQLAEVSGACLEIEAVIYPGSATECRLVLLCGDDDEKGSTIVYDTTRGIISLNGASKALVLADGELLKLRVFVDRSLVEVFANRRVCLSAWSYPRREAEGFVRLSAVGGSAQVKSVDVWQMRVIKE